MKEESLFVKMRRRHKYSSYQGEFSVAPEKLVNRDFHADKPNEKWLTDLTEFSIPSGKVYLSPVIDCFDGIPVNWEGCSIAGLIYIRWYCTDRIKSTLGWLSPLQYRKELGVAF